MLTYMNLLLPETTYKDNKVVEHTTISNCKQKVFVSITIKTLQNQKLFRVITSSATFRL
jgi:hypothetical protein